MTPHPRSFSPLSGEKEGQREAALRVQAFGQATRLKRDKSRTTNK